MSLPDNVRSYVRVRIGEFSFNNLILLNWKPPSGRSRKYILPAESVRSCGIYDISTLPGDVVLRPHSGHADRFRSCLLGD